MMPYRYSKRTNSSDLFLVSNSARGASILFRSSKDFKRFVQKLSEYSQNSSDINVIGYVLYPTAYFILIKEHKEGSLSKFMQRINVGYAMYFNSKYRSVGHVFSGPYKELQLDTPEDLLLELVKINRSQPNTQNKQKPKYSSLIEMQDEQAKWLDYQFYIDYFKEENFTSELAEFMKNSPS